MRRVWSGSAVAMLAMLLRAGVARAQTSDPVGVLPVWGVARPPRHGGGGPYRMPEATTYGVLDEMASRASVIFVGSVTSVRWLGGDDARDVASGVVAVEFAVEEAILGPPAGSTYVMREWAGLWRDAARFRVGQRRLMLLHAPGPAGLSSPVDGLDGAIPIAGGAAATPVSNTEAQRDIAPLPESRADLRWIQAKQMRVVTLAGEPVAEPGEQPAEPLAGTAPATGIVKVAGLPGVAARGAANAAVVVGSAFAAELNPPLTEVIGRLRAGEASPHVAR